MTTKIKEPYLSHVSGLTVFKSFESKKGRNFYEFIDPISGNMLCTTYCYKKAKMFAMGVDAGRKLSKQGN